MFKYLCEAGQYKSTDFKKSSDNSSYRDLYGNSYGKIVKSMKKQKTRVDFLLKLENLIPTSSPSRENDVFDSHFGPALRSQRFF